MGLLYTGLGAGAAGAADAYQGGEMLAGPKPYGTSAGGIAVAVAVICFSIAGYFWWQYRKGTFPGNKKSALTAAHQHAR
jgi:hypothetical protein